MLRGHAHGAGFQPAKAVMAAPRMPEADSVPLLKLGVPRRAGDEGEEAFANTRRIELSLDSMAHDEVSIRHAGSGRAGGEQSQDLRRYDKVAGAVLRDTREDGAPVDLARRGVRQSHRSA